MKQYKVSVYKFIEETSYKDGSTLDTVDHGEVFNFKSSELDLISERLESHMGLKVQDCDAHDGYLEFCVLETEDNSIPNDHQLALWKQDKIKMYCANYSIYLSLVETTELDATIFKTGGAIKTLTQLSERKV